MLSRKTHLAMAKELREVKKVLWDGKGGQYVHNYKTANYVCLAIEDRRNRRKVSPKIANPLLDWIDLQLDGTTAKNWAIRNYVFIDNYQEYRHAWVDNMIKILES
jgi:hypothetical protein